MDENFELVNTIFGKILPDRENIGAFSQALEIDLFRECVVGRLMEIENAADGHDWWRDEPLMLIFEGLSRNGIIVLPHDPIERIRWIALLSIFVAKREGFSYGNVLIPPDYLPDEEIEEWSDRYGWGVIERIQNLRSNLRSDGWQSVIGL